MNGVQATSDRNGNLQGALYLDGIDDFIQLPGWTWISGDFSFSGWFKLDNNGFFPHLWGFGNGTNAQNIFLSSSEGYDNIPHLTTHDCGTGSSYHRIKPPTIFPLNTWTHIVVTLQGNLVTFYKDGSFWSSATTTILPCLSQKDSAFIGKSNFTWNNNSLVHGAIDDFRFYDRALTLPEVQDLNELTETCSPEKGNEVQKDIVSIYPNPARETLIINGINPDNIESARLFAIDGRELLLIPGDRKTFHLPDTKGFHTLIIHLKDGPVVKKMIQIH